MSRIRSTTPRIALATCREFPALVEDDHPILARLQSLRVAAEPRIWNDDVDWSGYSAVVLRSVWDYFLHPAKFTAWLDSLERQRIPCWNPVPLVRWNLDKRYLRGLAAAGIATVPTLWIEPGGGASPEETAQRILDTGWPDVVLKPTISAGAWKTLRVKRDAVGSQAGYIREVLAGSGLMAQPFLPEIVEQGEHSLLFFGGEFSHAVVKRAKAGDFRVQWTHGGRQSLIVPPPSIIEQARAVLAAAPSPGLYARVDGVIRDGRLILMELEQIEPYLYLAEGSGSVDRFVEALVSRL